MSRGIRFKDAFKQDAVAQVVECGYGVRYGLKMPRNASWRP